MRNEFLTLMISIFTKPFSEDFRTNKNREIKRKRKRNFVYV